MVLQHLVLFTALAVGVSAADRRCTPIQRGTQFGGTTISTTSQANYFYCNDLCRDNTNCAAYTYTVSSSQCVLFSASTTENTDYSKRDNLYSAHCVTKEASAKLYGPSEPHTDYYGNDLWSQAAATATDCADICQYNWDCTAYTWTADNGGVCYVKRFKSETVTVSPAPSDGSVRIRSGEVYKCSRPMYDADITGQDLGSVLRSSWMECCGVCRNTANCNAFSWNNYNGGTCWLKTGAAGAMPQASGVISATLAA
ncbi:hypothetical protein Poli38472_011952 [Pythium oligandrum]|uniref:Apple domain-containing protein n=1 Tax=Pythium oligandrum TaxID=41045 RepID=A0A8K1CQH2_PYTOL|nr:hypothetical protein Poli38472_011952 [Pythium oligandrum]|eukprot:TMW66836.1 hypothetical protein Poli38472_011952 [Pythium oligandrum]